MCVPSKHCLVTGLDISMQKADSKLLGRTGIKFYLSHDPAIFAQLENRLSLKWKDEPEKIRIKEIAHSIENDFYNPRKSYRSRLNRCGQTLFDDSPYMVDRLRISLEHAKS